MKKVLLFIAVALSVVSCNDDDKATNVSKETLVENLKFKSVERSEWLFL